MTKYKSEDIRNYFNISHETVRRYAMDFVEFLSEGANPEKGQHRVYDESDLRVFAVIVSMKNSNHTDDDIKATLKAGAEGDLSEFIQDESVTLSPHVQTKLFQQQLSNMQTQLDAAVSDAQMWRDKAKTLEGQIAQLQKQLEGQADVIELHKEIARLTLMLEMAKGNHE